jgi:hypothetical protein
LTFAEVSGRRTFVEGVGDVDADRARTDLDASCPRRSGRLAILLVQLLAALGLIASPAPSGDGTPDLGAVVGDVLATETNVVRSVGRVHRWRRRSCVPATRRRTTRPRRPLPAQAGPSACAATMSIRRRGPPLRLAARAQDLLPVRP